MWKRMCEFFHTHQKKLRLGIIWLGVGFVYYVITQLTPFRIPCLFQTITGLACPGCGISHFCIRLLHLDFLGAARENLAIACLLPVWLISLAVYIIWHPKWLTQKSPLTNGVLWGSIALLLLFGILRNLPHLEFLLPSYLR